MPMPDFFIVDNADVVAVYWASADNILPSLVRRYKNDRNVLKAGDGICDTLTVVEEDSPHGKTVPWIRVLCTDGRIYLLPMDGMRAIEFAPVE